MTDTNTSEKSITKRIEDKEGRNRRDLMSKRTDFCARSVATSVPNEIIQFIDNETLKYLGYKTSYDVDIPSKTRSINIDSAPGPRALYNQASHDDANQLPASNKDT